MTENEFVSDQSPNQVKNQKLQNQKSMQTQIQYNDSLLYQKNNSMSMKQKKAGWKFHRKPFSNQSNKSGHSPSSHREWLGGEPRLHPAQRHVLAQNQLDW